MEVLRIWGMCIAAAILYGIVHDQVTARVCVEYFTVYHPHVINSTSPTLLALTWGVLATWWVGAILGYLLVLAARLGRRPRLTACDLLRPLLLVLAAMAVVALGAGVIGYCTDPLTPRFSADLWAHTASYITGTLGGIALCIWTLRRRRWLAQHPECV